MVTIPVDIPDRSPELSERNLLIQLTDPYGHRLHPSFTTTSCKIQFTFWGVEQKSLGCYSIRIWENINEHGQCMQDIVDAFELVATTDEEAPGCPPCPDSKDVSADEIHFGITELSINAGKDGKSAYEAAREKGFTGTEEEFNVILSNARPVDNLEDESDVKPLSANQGRILNEKINNTNKWFNLTD